MEYLLNHPEPKPLCVCYCMAMYGIALFEKTSEHIESGQMAAYGLIHTSLLATGSEAACESD